jgi:hypothetical protein
MIAFALAVLQRMAALGNAALLAPSSRSLREPQNGWVGRNRHQSCQRRAARQARGAALDSKARSESSPPSHRSLHRPAPPKGRYILFRLGP